MIADWQLLGVIMQASEPRVGVPLLVLTVCNKGLTSLGSGAVGHIRLPVLLDSGMERGD